MTNNNDRLTELFTRAQASDYSRRPAPITFADVLVMFFVGIITTLVLAFIMGA